jgi:hypothetical protein
MLKVFGLGVFQSQFWRKGKYYIAVGGGGGGIGC